MWAVESDTEQILKGVLAGAPFVPALSTVIGNTTVEWWDGQSGDAVVMASGGSGEDRWLGEQIVASQLAAVGYKRAQFTFDAEHHTAGWPDIMQKAKRLVQSGNITLLRNGWNNIVAHVIGDHGEYNCEIGRDDPESRSITTWQCECPWDQYAWQRTRQWKKYEGRPCAHVMATFWKSQATPLDDHDPNEHGPLPPGQKGGEEGGPPPSSPPPGGAPPPAPAQGPAPTPSPIEQSSPAGMAPPGEGPLPTPPMDQLAEQMPPVPGQTPGGMPANPAIVSVPGAKMPTPFNPIQFPGGTYSRVSMPITQPSDSEWKYYKDDEDRFMHNGCGVLAQEIHNRTGWPMFGEYSPEELSYRKEGEISHPDHVFVQHPSGQMLDARGLNPWPERAHPLSSEQLGQSFEAEAIGFPEAHPMAGKVADYLLQKHGKVATEQFVAPEIVRLKNEGYGIAEGKSEAHGAGQYQSIAPGSEGEVLGQDSATGWVEVIFPLQGGNLTPYHVKIFCEPGEIEHTDKPPPGPFIKRR